MVKYSIFYVLVGVFMLSAIITKAETGTVRGSVFDGQTGESLVGVTIAVKGTAKGTISDLDGKFSLTLEAGTYELVLSYISYQTITIEDVNIMAGEVTLLNNLKLKESTVDLQEVVVTAKQVRTSEAAIHTIKRKSATIMDGISADKMKLAGDATAVEAAKRVTGVSIEDGKYVFIRGLGDRYSKTTLNGMDIPGLDPDKNSLQMDIFPTNLIDNITVKKNFTSDMPADFTGGIMNIEIKDFPEEKITTVSLSTSYNPDMHFNPDYLTYEGGKTDFLGFDDGTRALPQEAESRNIPTPISGHSTDEVRSFINSFNPVLGASRQTSLLDLSASISTGNQIDLKSKQDYVPKLGYIFSLSYKSDYKYFDDAVFGEYQKYINPDRNEMRYATFQNGKIGEKNALIGLLGGLAYKTNYSKIRLMTLHLQDGQSQAGQFIIVNDGAAVGQSGYIASSDVLSYNQRSITNVLLNGTHKLSNLGWEIDWRIAPTYSTSNEPDIRKTAFTLDESNTNLPESGLDRETAFDLYEDNDVLFRAGAGGNPSRIWRSLNELSIPARLDFIRKYDLLDTDALLKFGVGHTYKQRDYEILLFDMQFFGTQAAWSGPYADHVLLDDNLYPSGNIYYSSGNPEPNPNAYESNVHNTGLYLSNELTLFENLKTILGVRAENYVQRHTGRDQTYASGDEQNGHNLENEKVLESLDFYPSVNFIYSLKTNQNIRTSYSKTIARGSFKEVSYAQILDPLSNRIFNGSLYTYNNWNGILKATHIDNYDFRWELFMPGAQIFSASAFYKTFTNPIELVRIPEQQTSTEYQPRNVGNGELYGVELEFRKNFGFISFAMENFSLSGNFAYISSRIDMSDAEYNSRKSYEKTGEKISNYRVMAGQAPYLVNMGFSYNNNEIGMDAGLFYNVKGPVLYIVGGGLFPDIYNQSFHSLDFSVSKSIGEYLAIDFKASNILNDRHEQVYKSYKAEDQPFDMYSPGRSFSLGASMNF